MLTSRRDRFRALLPVVPSVLCTLVGLPGCGGEETAVAEATVRDSAGVVIVENPDRAVEVAPRWRVDPAPLLEIGTLEGEPDQQFSVISDVATLSDGTVVVGHNQPPELRFYAADGTHLRTAGGEGEGPGEFRRVAAVIRLPGDTLLVHDWNLNRTSRFGPDGSFLESVTLGGGEEGGLGGNVVGRLEDGTLVVEPFTSFGGGSLPEEGVHRYDSPLLAYEPDGSLRDTLLVRPGRAYHVRRSGGGFRVTVGLFSTGPYQAVAPDALFTAHSRAWEIEVRAPDGEVHRIVRLDRPRRPVTGAALDSLIERRVDDIDDPDRRRERETEYREMPVPDLRPAFDALGLDAEGHLWARETDGGDAAPDRWIVFGPDGRVRAVATLPPRFFPHEIARDRVVGRWTDELGVPYVRIYWLRKDGGEADGAEVRAPWDTAHPCDRTGSVPYVRFRGRQAVGGVDRET